MTTFYGNALVINGYDSDLKQLFQQVMPVDYSNGFPLTTGYSLSADGLKIVANTDDSSVYGQLDMSTGKWSKLTPINTDASVSDQHIIWFNDGCLVPCLHRRGFGSKYNVDMVLAVY